jgi:hypothetical protein
MDIYPLVDSLLSHDGITGTLTLDDGANWNVQLRFNGGILEEQTIGASTSATAIWT